MTTRYTRVFYARSGTTEAAGFRVGALRSSRYLIRCRQDGVHQPQLDDTARSMAEVMRKVQGLTIHNCNQQGD